MFEKASRLKLKFATVKGNYKVDDLWDFTLTDLNKLAKSLNAELKSADDEDFLSEVTTDDVTKLKFDIVLHILNFKKDVRDKAKLAKDNKIKKDKIANILASREDDALEKMTDAELIAASKEL